MTENNKTSYWWQNVYGKLYIEDDEGRQTPVLEMTVTDAGVPENFAMKKVPPEQIERARNVVLEHDRKNSCYPQFGPVVKNASCSWEWDNEKPSQPLKKQTGPRNPRAMKPWQ